MTISFRKYNKNRQKEAEKEQLIQEFESINPDDAVLAAIMRATGQNTICGVDYSLQKERIMDQADKYNEVTSRMLNKMNM